MRVGETPPSVTKELWLSKYSKVLGGSRKNTIQLLLQAGKDWNRATLATLGCLNSDLGWGGPCACWLASRWRVQLEFHVGIHTAQGGQGCPGPVLACLPSTARRPVPGTNTLCTQGPKGQAGDTVCCHNSSCPHDPPRTHPTDHYLNIQPGSNTTSTTRTHPQIQVPKWTQHPPVTRRLARESCLSPGSLSLIPPSISLDIKVNASYCNLCYSSCVQGTHQSW